jgi:hypothetical protein
MSQEKIAKKYLENKICSTCSQYKFAVSGIKKEEWCEFWFGEACGWQVKEIAEERTCEYWAESREEHARK